MYQHIHINTVQTPGGQLNPGGLTKEAAAVGEFDETIANAVTDGPILVNIDVSQVKSIVLLSDKNVTLETNNAGTPVDTIVLKANVPYIWHTDSYDTLKLTADVTTIFVTNASGSSARIQGRWLYDPTV